MSKTQKPGGKLKRKSYEEELRKLQVRLCQLQEWVKEKGLRVIIIFEGRDTAGKGGTIKALVERKTRRRQRNHSPKDLAGGWATGTRQALRGQD